MELHDANVGCREEIGANHPAQKYAHCPHQDQAYQDERAMAHDHREHRCIGVLQPFERRFARSIETCTNTAAVSVIVMLAGKQLTGQHRHQRERQDVRSEQREHHRQRERNEQEL
jgi:hypothetical protein